MKFGQILMCCMTNISNMFLAQFWRLESSSRPFYDFIKMVILRDLAIFNSWYLPILNVPVHLFEKMKHWNLDVIGYLVISYLEKDLKLSPILKSYRFSAELTFNNTFCLIYWEGKRYNIETLSTDSMLNKKYFHGKIMRKMCNKS